MKTELWPCYTKEQALMLSPLQLAFVGDSVHALLVRTSLMEKDLPVREMHRKATAQVNAVSQSKKLQRLLPMLTEEEISVVKRGRNAHARHGAPKSASVGEYAGATGLEALLGFLYLTGNAERLMQIASLLEKEDETE